MEIKEIKYNLEDTLSDFPEEVLCSSKGVFDM